MFFSRFTALPYYDVTLLNTQLIKHSELNILRSMQIRLNLLGDGLTVIRQAVSPGRGFIIAH